MDGRSAEVARAKLGETEARNGQDLVGASDPLRALQLDPEQQRREPERLAAGSGLLLWARADSPPLVPADLPPTDRQLVEFLLLLPVAALVCCVVRILIGLHTYGTFAPALLGLAFREVHSLIGIAVFVGILLCGWLLRRGLRHGAHAGGFRWRRGAQ